MERARPAYDESVADYRQTVLAAFQEVEDHLAAARWLAEEARIQEDAARLARERWKGPPPFPAAFFSG